MNLRSILKKDTLILSLSLIAFNILIPLHILLLVGEILSAIAQTDMNVNCQVTVTRPQKYTEEVRNQMKGVADSVHHINTTSHSSSIKASLSHSANDIKHNTYYIK